MADYLPRRDAELLQWAKNFSAQVSEDPGAYGLTAAMAADVAQATAAFATALRVATEPTTRTGPAIQHKDATRAALEQVLRAAVRMVRGTPGVGSDQLNSLGLRLREAKRRRVPAPAESPRVVLSSMAGGYVRVRLYGRHTDRRGKPADVAGATIYTHVGHEAPVDITGWRAAKTTTSPDCKVAFAMGLPPGTKVWVTACWLSPTAAPGPLSHPVAAYLTPGLRFGASESMAA